MTSNPLTDVLTPAVRRYLYAAYALAGLIVGALAVAQVDVGKAPDVLAYIGVALGATAASNVTPPKVRRNERGAMSIEGAFVCVILVVILIVVLRAAHLL